MDEQALASYCSKRDRLAEEELYRRYADRVFALCRRYVGDADEAKDLMLEALIQALDKIDTYTFRLMRLIALLTAIRLIQPYREPFPRNV
ncbi:MAG: hypothetical protein K6G79_08050 [Bacteroidales bacterium]|nr:hypothetical protein [Bacteroidales bacterium]